MPSAEFVRKGQIVRRKNVGVDSIDNVAGIRDILSSPHLLLNDTFRALLVTNLPRFTTQGGHTQRVKPICYACKLGDCN